MSYSFIQSDDDLWLLIGIFRPFTPNVVIDMVVFIRLSLCLFVFHLSICYSVFFLPSFGSIGHFLYFYFITLFFWILGVTPCFINF